MSFPNMAREHGDWAKRANFILVDKNTVDREITEDLSDSCKFQGIFYQHSAQEMNFKSEGQRGWRWWHLVTTKNISLDDMILKDDVRYRVMTRQDWIQAGFFEYEVAESFIEA